MFLKRIQVLLHELFVVDPIVIDYQNLIEFIAFEFSFEQIIIDGLFLYVRVGL